MQRMAITMLSNLALDASYSQPQKLRAGWFEILNRYEWKLFVTLTYDPQKSRRTREAVFRDFRKMANCFNVKFFKKHWHRHSKDLGLHYVSVGEQHGSGAWHAHVLIGAPRQISPQEQRWMHDWWFSRHGRLDVQLIRDSADVQRYCLKHVKTGDEVEFSSNLRLRTKL